MLQEVSGCGISEAGVQQTENNYWERMFTTQVWKSNLQQSLKPLVLCGIGCYKVTKFCSRKNGKMIMFASGTMQ